MCRLGCGATLRTSRRSPSSRRTNAAGPSAAPSRFSTASPGPGPTGAGRAAISMPRMTPAPISTRCASCSAARWQRPIRRNGSTPDCIGPTASMARRRANERLAGGGRSSGLMSFLKIGDRAAGAIKSGGTTRRAAKMVTVDIDHPDIEDYIDWKVREEQKVAALVSGSKLASKHLNLVMLACVEGEALGDDRVVPAQNPSIKREDRAAHHSMITVY